MSQARDHLITEERVDLSHSSRISLKTFSLTSKKDQNLDLNSPTLSPATYSREPLKRTSSRSNSTKLSPKRKRRRSKRRKRRRQAQDPRRRAMMNPAPLARKTKTFCNPFLLQAELRRRRRKRRRQEPSQYRKKATSLLLLHQIVKTVMRDQGLTEEADLEDQE